MKPKLLVESNKYLKQVFQGTVLFLCNFFPTQDCAFSGALTHELLIWLVSLPLW